MASSVIGALRVNLGMDTAQFEAGASRARKTTSGLQGALGGFASSFSAVAAGAAVGTAAIAAFTYGMQAAAKAADFADKLAAQASKLGVSAEYLQAFGFAAGEVDVEIEAAQDAMMNLTAAIGALQTRIGDGKIRKAMEGLGIPQEQIDSFRTAQDALPVLADRISKLGTVTEQLQFAKKFGISELLPMLQQGGDGIRAMMERASALGLVIDEDVVSRLADMSRELEIADQRMQTASNSLGGSLTPALVVLKNSLADAANEMASFLDQFNRIEKRATSSLEARRSDAYEQMSNLLQKGVKKKDGSLMFGFEKKEYERQLRIYNETSAELERRRRERRSASATTATSRVGSYSSGGGSARSSRGSASRENDEETQAELFYQVQSNNNRLREEMAKDAFDKTILKPQVAEIFAEGAAAGAAQGLVDSRERIREDYQYAIEGGLYAAIHGGGKGLMQYLADEFQRSMVESLAESLSKVLQDAAGGSKGSIWSSAASFAGTFFGVGKNALGTSNWRGGPTWVGERGPEILNLPRGSQITPNHKLGGVQVIKVEVDKTPYFDVAVREQAAPVAAATSMVAGETSVARAGQNQARASRYRMG